MNNAIVLSDFHLFSERCDPVEILEKLDQYCYKIEHLFLLGDIFDFKWSQYPLEKTVKFAQQWFENLLNRYPHLQINYVMGNHDAWQLWAERLVAYKHHRFTWAEDMLQFDDALFMHGDLPLYRQTERMLYHSKPKPSWLRKGYRALMETKIQNEVIKFNSIEKHCQQIIDWLELKHFELSKIKRIYFGHTHLPIDGHQVQQIKFYNSGSLVKHMPNQPHLFNINERHNV